MEKCLNKLWYIQKVQYYTAFRFTNNFNGISKFLQNSINMNYIVLLHTFILYMEKMKKR